MALPAFRPKADPFAPGAIVAGKYRIEREVAEGGIGVVHLCTHVQLQQRAAIKRVHTRVLAKPALLERFRREAQVMAQLRSQHVVRVYDVGEVEDAGPYMVMEFLEGEDLGSILERGPLAPVVAVDCILQACDAIAEAHAMGIIHRDLKPENLFVARRASDEPIVKVLDFGISKVAAGKAGSVRLARMTEANDRFGTPMYMSPEQLRASGNVDPRSDIWALGVVLFELLTASLPFDADNVPQLAAQIATSPSIPLRQLQPGMPAELEAVILRCLEKDPARRYRNVAELAQDLVAFGPASAGARLTRIRRITETAGTSVRPPAPSSPTLASLPAIAGRQTQDAFGVRSYPSFRPFANVRHLGLFGGGGGLVLLAVLLFGLLRTRHPTNATTPSAPASNVVVASPTGVEGSPVQTAAPTRVPVVVHPIVATTTDAGGVPPLPSAPPATPNAASAASSHAVPPSVPSTRPTSESPRPAPKPKKSDYDEFGGRR